jgi:hypothetical protein
MLLLLFVLACFAGLQTATAVDLHSHEHAGPHQHCCSVCHAGHLPALQTAGGCPLAPPTALEWRGCGADTLIAAYDLADFHPSRAPPSLV